MACCSPWGCKESDMTEQQNSKEILAERTQAQTVFLWSDGLFILEIVLVVCVFPRNLPVSSKLSHFRAYSCLEYCNLFISLRSVVMSRFSFLIFSNVNHLSFSLVSLAKCCQFC